MATRLGIYNEALRMLGARRIANLTENNKNRNTLDQIWTLDDDAFGLVNRCLQEGYWNFAMRTALFQADSSIEPDFGYRFGFQQPSDYSRINEISLDEYFNYPLRDYRDENKIWYLDNEEIYVRYVSKSPQYGNDLGKFPPTFTKFVAAFMAAEAAPTISNSSVQTIETKLKRARVNARSKDALEEGARQPPQGSWANARFLGTRSASSDGGSRNNLIG